jgi:hypothetical protein
MTDEVLFGTGMESSLIDEDSFTSVYGNSCRLYMKKYRNDIINQLVERDKHAFSFGFGLIPIIVSVLALVVSFIGLFT